MVLTGVFNVFRAGAGPTLYHEECYNPGLLARYDTVLRFIQVPDWWIDPGCAVCGKALAVYPVDEQMERDFLRTVDECENEVAV